MVTMTPQEQTRAILDLLRCEDNWNSYGAVKPTRDSIERLGSIIDTLNDAEIPITNMGPNAMGGCGLTVFIGEHEVVIEPLNDGRTLVTDILGADVVSISDVSKNVCPTLSMMDIINDIKGD